MDNAADRRHELLDAMEVCRAASGDLRDPQLAELAAALEDDSKLRAQWERLQGADAAIKAVMVDVPVPADLAARVLCGLAEATSMPSAEVGPFCRKGQLRPNLSPDSSSSSDSERVSPARQAGPTASLNRFSRRRLMVGFAAISASAALLAAVWLHTHQAPPITRDGAIAEAMQVFNQEPSPSGEFVSLVPPPVNYPISSEIRPMPDIRWRRVGKFLGGEAVAYDLPSRNGKATLYVSHRSIADMPTFPRSVPELSTGGNSAGAWQSDGMLYVLVVQGDDRAYADYLDRSSGPLT
jgi:hypothetical protein